MSADATVSGRRFLRFWRRLGVGLLLFVILGGVGSPGWAAAPDRHIVVEARSFTELIRVEGGPTPPAARLVVRVSTQFWADGRALSPAELTALAPHLSFADASYRGHSILLAVPPVGEVSLLGVATDASIRLALASGAGQGPDETVAATMAEAVWLRDQRVVRVRFQPLQVDPVSSEIDLHPTITATIALADVRPTSATPRPDPHWEPIYRQALANYLDGRRWRSVQPPAPDGLAGAAPIPVDGSWRLRVTVSQPGLYEVGFEDLVGLGMEVGGIDPRRLQVFDGAAPIPALVRGEEDGRLDAGDGVIFYAPPARPSRYSGDHVFWLVLGAEAGARVGQRTGAGQALVLPSFTETAHREVQRLYYSHFPLAEAADHWFWLNLRPGRTSPTRQVATFTLDGVAVGPDRARVRIRTWGQDDGIAHVDLHLAGYPVGAFDVEGRLASTHEYTIPHALLQSGANELAIEVSKTPTSTNSVLLDWLEVDYMRLYEAVEGRLQADVDWPEQWQVWLGGLDATAAVWDVTDPVRPLALTELQTAGDGSGRVGFVSVGAGPLVYAAATAAARRPDALAWAPVLDELRSPDNRADYLIITPRALLPAAQRLAQHRAATGLAVKVVSTEAIADEFNAGGVHPQAIRSFLAAALSYWRAPAPAFVVMLGDGTIDPLGYLGAPPVQAPVLLRMLDPWLGEVADENAYAAVVGADIVPDLMYGRLPAGSLADADRLVDKIVGYDGLAVGESWQQRLLLVADNPDGAGDFTRLAEDIAMLAAPSLEIRRLYLADFPTADRLRADLLADWSEGALVVNYIGHGQPGAWAAEQILNKAEAPRLQNRDRPAVVLAMASLSGVFTQPGGASLLEDLLLLPDGRGAVGYVASTGYGISVGNALVNEGFMDAILVDKADRLGRASVQAKLHLYTQGYDFTEYLTRLYTLVGDPATRLPLLPWAESFYLPVVRGR
ncbi:MAG: hypothetical protein KIS63_03615 [Caldilineales bacterium]|nr:hypothetical protein [Caldilineales bacterium]